jgi:alpha-2-macroglobulin
MVTFCPNIFVLVYLNRTRQLSQTLLRKGIENIQRAYRRQIQFRRWHPKGSFSSFGDRDSHGNTWLTAFVMKSFCQVKLLNVSAEIVDTSVVETGLEWLSSKQRLLGDFQEDGGRPHFSVKGPREYQCSLTAFVTIAFLECSSRTTLVRMLVRSDT